MTTDVAHAAEARFEVERVFREVSGHAVATLVRLFGDIAAAEDAVQDAFVVATHRWPSDGVPPNPAGWIITTARRRAIDQLRRGARGRELISSQQHTVEQSTETEPDLTAARETANDDRLRLIFTCCHPSLRPEHRIALTLRLLGGLSVEAIANGFLVSEAAMTKRLTRAKYKIKATNIPYRVPDESELAARLWAALSVLYLIYNAGTDNIAERSDLRSEALRLGRALVEMVPDEPEPAGLLALMLLNESRVPARSINGAVVLLRDQDRTAWNREMIDEGHTIVRRCIQRDRPGQYQLQAAIQAVHCHADTFESTDWHQILALYDHLQSIAPSPVVALNRAIAVSETNGPSSALAILDTLQDQLANYYPLHAARAVMLRDLSRPHESADAFARAAALTSSDAQRQHFDQQARALTQRRG